LGVLLGFWALARLVGCSSSGSSDSNNNSNSSGSSDSNNNSNSDGAAGSDSGAAPPCMLPISDSAHAANLATLGTSLDAMVTGFEHSHLSGGTITCPAPGSTSEATSDWGYYAWIKLARGTDTAGTALALAALNCMFTFQDLTTGSATYGVFRYHVNNTPNPSDNSTETALSPVGWILADKLLPAASTASLNAPIQAALNAIDAHEECPDYTNICLLQQAERLSIGAAFSASSDASLASDGAMRTSKAMTELDNWAATVKTGGVREFDSPTYGENDLEDLLLARQGAMLLNSQALARVDGMLDYLWSDFAANTSSRETLAPPYSRTYDFAGGEGTLSYALWLEGLAAQTSATVGYPFAAWLSTSGSSGYRPPASSLCWSAATPREVVSEYQGSGRTQRNRYAYLTSDFSLGTTTATYVVNNNANLDILVGGSLVSGPSTPLLSVLPDWFDAPLAQVQAGAFSKAFHLTLDPAAVQDKGALLVLARIDASDPNYPGADGGTLPLVNLTTNLIVPAKVDAVLVNGTGIDPSTSGTAAFPPLVVAQNQTGVLGMGVIGASGLDCVQSSGAITETGTPHVDVLPLAVPGEDPAVRVAIRHLDAPPADVTTLANCFARVALLMVGRHCDGSGCGASLSSDMQAALASATSSYDLSTGAWSVTLQAPGGGPMLHVARQTATAGVVTEATVNGMVPPAMPLGINGTPIVLSP
jgi:hypothetical protein